ncbi:MAG: AI-2E family transporter [Bacteroidetes bacterium]|nr:MAG: AI-2E family transporter [Bacteroidota bacterium]
MMEVSKSAIRQMFFLLLLLAVTAAFFGLIQPFFMAVFWAAVFAITFRRMYRIIRWKMRGRSNLATLTTLTIILLAVVIPTILIMLSLVDQGEQIYRKVQSGRWNAMAVVDYVDQQMPLIKEQLAKLNLTPERIRSELTTLGAKAANAIANQAISYTQDALTLTAQFFLMLYVLYFFLRDGHLIVRQIINAIPLDNRQEYALVHRFSSVVRATLRGTVIVAVVQGSLGGIMFAVLGIEGALFWGVVMTLLSLLPIGGSAIVWGPTALVLLVQGAYARGIAMILIGSVLIGTVDNFLRPTLVGRDTKLPDYLVLLATLGGIAWFGLSGFVLGPVIAALFVTCWEMAGLNYGGKE